ncbi:hypothetical protein QRO08_09745 [Paracidovorax citrulli]|uniref:Lipoprotein n=1 Tax=Paracidovorax citrulli TaxID=80869 RepID=A0ABY9AV62_PARCI|nr:hypothetical protein [Paracidovorax citrulli]ATG93096.1 hypothetical protein CQB05_02750 [Paracidovorax citrulli]MVT36781.1 hypothetical protein [Paracidovorax citrulli]PVY67154.1 hypothetical protein C8E08_4589 [Paracidovorax citrulli]REG68683.1 hypothetical protein C8E07_1802 [Paracidovorax citrulli]RLJ93238.1 hypothetical protein C8E06_1802 [Paracidovorax citrulli]
MTRATILAALLLAGCSAAPPQAPAVPAESAAAALSGSPCPPLPELRAGASSLERRLHTQAIVRMYAACAGSQP